MHAATVIQFISRTGRSARERWNPKCECGSVRLWPATEKEHRSTANCLFNAFFSLSVRAMQLLGCNSKWHSVCASSTLLFLSGRAKIYLLCFRRHFSNGAECLCAVCNYCILLSFVVFISFDLWDNDLLSFDGRTIRFWRSARKYTNPCKMLHSEKTHYRTQPKPIC